MNKINEAAVRRRAYEIWEKAGRPHGLDEDHWHQANAEATNLEAREVAPKSPRKTMRAAAAAVAPSPVRRKK